MRTVLILAALLLPAAAHAESGPSPEGDWSRGDGKARVHIAPCGDDLCAVNTWIRPGTKDEKVGDKLVMSVKETAPGQWTGKAADPQRHMTYRFSMTVTATKITTRGCVLGGLICKSMPFTRM